MLPLQTLLSFFFGKLRDQQPPPPLGSVNKSVKTNSRRAFSARCQVREEQSHKQAQPPLTICALLLLELSTIPLSLGFYPPSLVSGSSSNTCKHTRMRACTPLRFRLIRREKEKKELSDVFSWASSPGLPVFLSVFHRFRKIRDFLL